MAHRSTRQAGRHRAAPASTAAPRHAAARHRAPRRARATTSWRPQLVLASSVTVATTALLVGAADPSEPAAAHETAASDSAAATPATVLSRAEPISRGGARSRAAGSRVTPQAVRADRAARAAEEAEAARAAAARDALPDWLRACETTVDPSGFANGELPEESLCTLPLDGHQLESGAAEAWWRLDEAYQAEFGEPMCLTDTYRSLDEQYALRAAKPTLTADPGTSTHGWGTAIDFCGGVESFGTPQHVWLRDNGPRFGWVNPDWAQETGSMPEPWHWEHLG